MKWAGKHILKLQSRYPEKWAVIFKEHVVAVAECPGTPVKLAQEKTGVKDIPVIFVESGENLY